MHGFKNNVPGVLKNEKAITVIPKVNEIASLKELEATLPLGAIVVIKGQ